MSNFEETLSSLGETSIDELEALMKKTRDTIKAKEQEELSKRESKFEEDFKPFEDRIKSIEKKLEVDLESIDAEINLLRESKKTIQLVSQDEITNVLVEYNKKRKELGLPVKTLRTIKTGGKVTTRNRTGESHKYDIDWLDENEDKVKIMIDKNPDWTFILDTSGGLPVKEVENAMKSFGIDVRGGGMCRGVINRVRKLKLSKRNEQHSNTSV